MLSDNVFLVKGEAEEFYAMQQRTAFGASMPVRLAMATIIGPLVGMLLSHDKRSKNTILSSPP